MDERPQPRSPIRRRAAFASAAAALLASVAAPLTGQPAEAPKSLLPDAFRNAEPARPVAPPPPLPGVTPPDATSGTTAGTTPGTTAGPDDTAPLAQDSPDSMLAGLPEDAPADPLAAPPPLDPARTGVLDVARGGWGEAVFAASDGVYLAGLARRIQAPIASRSASIALRRAMLSRAAAPARLLAGDWVAARAWLLLRMGEIDAAELLLASLPPEASTPAHARITGQVALAAGDIGLICPVTRTGRRASADPLWELAAGICAALEGDDISAAAIFDSLRNRAGGVSPFDLRLGERVVVMAGGGGRATNINWTEAPRLTPYRYGVAIAAGVAIPTDRLADLGPVRHGWLVRQPALAPDQRLASLAPAAVQGSVSARELVSGIAALAPDDENASLATQLRTAFAGAGAGQRVAAMKSLWGRPVPGLDDADARYAGLILTAPAVARLTPDDSVEDDTADLIASLLTTGNIAAARRWWPQAQAAGGSVAARAWALLAVSGAGVPVTPERFKDWQDATSASDAESARLLGLLAGLGLARDAGWNGLRADLLPTTETGWSRAINAAADARRPGEVMLLAATGLQGKPAAVPALHWWQITQALTRVGRSREARLIAAEALSRR